MNPIQFGQGIGYANAKARVAELEHLMGMNESEGLTSPSQAQNPVIGAEDFNSFLQNSMNGPSPLQGSIGSLSPESISPLSPFSPGLSVSGGKNSALKQMISRIAIQNGIEPNLLDAVVQQESDYNPMLRSSAGALGLTQLMPGTAAEYGITNPFDPEQNLNGGAKYLKAMLNKFGSLPLALAAYNAGPHAVQKYGGVPPYSETQNYVRKIMQHIQNEKISQVSNGG